MTFRRITFNDGWRLCIRLRKGLMDEKGVHLHACLPVGTVFGLASNHVATDCAEREIIR